MHCICIVPFDLMTVADKGQLICLSVKLEQQHSAAVQQTPIHLQEGLGNAEMTLLDSL